MSAHYTKIAGFLQDHRLDVGADKVEATSAPAVGIWYNPCPMFQKLHARLGDFWWYSLMLFVACRSGDVIQAFIGLLSLIHI